MIIFANIQLSLYLSRYGVGLFLQLNFLLQTVLLIHLFFFMFICQDCDGTTWLEMQNALCKKLAELYDEHEYVYNKLSKFEKRHFDQIYSGILQYEITKDALVDLSKYLKNYHNKRCIVLIDEYDHPLNTAYHEGFYREARSFFASLFGALLKVNIYL